MLSKGSNKLKGLFVGSAGPNDEGKSPGRLPPLDAKVEAALREAGIPLVSCHECPSSCDPTHPEAEPSELFDEKLLSAWSKQDIDFKSPMFPSNGPFLRHVLVSTGKRDWPHDIASVEGTLAALYSRWAEEESPLHRKGRGDPKGQGQEKDESGEEAKSIEVAGPVLPTGCWRTNPGAVDRPSRLLIGNSSQISSSHHPQGQSVMLFPDYEVLCNVQDATDKVSSGSSSSSPARNAYDAYVSPSSSSFPPPSSLAATTTSLQAARREGVRRYVLPYKAVVVLCSHKKRDARCGISAPLLADVFRRHAEAERWEVDERGDDLDHSHTHSPVGATDEEQGDGDLQWNENGTVKNRGWGYIHDGPSSSQSLSPDEQSLLWRKSLSLSSSSSSSSSSFPSPPPPTLAIFHTSHIGKHKFAGNVMVYLPNRAGVWYGRVNPLNGAAGQVWQQTILQGRIIPEFLRLGINLWRGAGKGESSTSNTTLEGEAEAEAEEKRQEEEAPFRVSGLRGNLKDQKEGQTGILQW